VTRPHRAIERRRLFGTAGLPKRLEGDQSRGVNLMQLSVGSTHME
jgi:hypothetical protein